MKSVEEVNDLLFAFLTAKEEHAVAHKAAETSRFALKAAHTRVISARAALMAVIDDDPAKEAK